MNVAKIKHPLQLGFLIVAACLFALIMGAPRIARAISDNSSTKSYQAFLSDRDPSGSKVGFGSLTKDKDFDGNPLTLLENGKETKLSKGLLAHAPSTLFYTDIQDYGYEYFDALVGINASKRSSQKASVNFQVYGDGDLLWESGALGAHDNAKHVHVDISGVSVLKLVVDDKGTNTDDHAVWGEAYFSKTSATPYLAVSAKEFSTPEQVTQANLLEGTFARTLSGPLIRDDKPITSWRGYTLRNGKEGNDLSDRITCSTNYVAGKTGTFKATYSVTDEAGLTRTRTVPFTVRSTERVRTDADIEYLTTPFASYLYMSRDYFDEQGKKGFDLVLNKLLHVCDAIEKDNNVYPLVVKYGEKVRRISIDLQSEGIYMRKDQAAFLSSVLMDNDPRMFHLKDWGTEVSDKDGMAGTVTFYMPERYGDKNNQTYWYNNRLLAVEKNASRFLKNLQDGMTDAQCLRAVLEPYKNWIRYAGGGQLMDEALADGTGVCGGNARGAIYLAERIGVKAYWVRTGSHAWSMMKPNEEGAYYRVDLLAYPGCFLSVDGGDYTKYHGHHDQINFNRSPAYPDVSFEGFPYAHTAWPNLTLTVKEDVHILVPSDKASFDPKSLVVTCSSIYDGDLIDEIAYDDGGLSEKAEGNGFTPGYYKITYSIKDSRGNVATAEAHVQVVREGDLATDLEPSTNNGTKFQNVSLWTGTAEQEYSSGLLQHESKSVTFNVEGKGYTYFDAWVGINGSVRNNKPWGQYGKVQLEVIATTRAEDGSEQEQTIATSPIMDWYTPQHHILVALPQDTVAVTLRNVPKGNGNNHAAWGNPRFLDDEILDHVPIAPTISGVEDGAVYERGQTVVPLVSNADQAVLYRRDLPVQIAPQALALFFNTNEDESEIEVDSPRANEQDYGEPVEGWKSGDAVSQDGIYTLVAAGEAGLTTELRFQIGDYMQVDPVPPQQPEWSINASTATPKVTFGQSVVIETSAVDTGLGQTPSSLELIDAETNKVISETAANADGHARFELSTEAGQLPVGISRIAVRVSSDQSAVSDPLTITVLPAAPHMPEAIGIPGDLVAGDTAARLPKTTEALGVNNVKVPGTLTWYWDADHNRVVTADAVFSSGDIQLYWAFTPQNANYQAISGKTSLTIGGNSESNPGTDNNSQGENAPNSSTSQETGDTQNRLNDNQKDSLDGDLLVATGDSTFAPVIVGALVAGIVIITGLVVRYRTSS